jgi:periplasmic protein TonB
MFSRLPESNAVRQRRTGGLVVSTVVHALVIALAVRATMLTAAPSPKGPSPLPPVYVAPPERAPTTQRTPPPQRNSAAPTTSAPMIPDIPQPVITADVPNTIPDLGATILRGSEGFSRTTIVSGPEPDGGAPNVADGSPLPERFVEKVVVALPGTAPRYPDMLRQAGVEGDVRAQFVVDTLGRVEPGSLRVLEATHDQFAAAVRTALSSRARFKPAEAGGHKVRQLVEQTFTFRLDGKD